MMWIIQRMWRVDHEPSCGVQFKKEVKRLDLEEHFNHKH